MMGGPRHDTSREADARADSARLSHRRARSDAQVLVAGRLPGDSQFSRVGIAARVRANARIQLSDDVVTRR